MSWIIEWWLVVSVLAIVAILVTMALDAYEDWRQKPYQRPSNVVDLRAYQLSAASMGREAKR